MAKPPNIVLIGIDSLSAGHMSGYGYHRLTTPHLDRFASDAVLFERTFSPVVPTTPAYCSMLSGLDCFSTQVVALRHQGPVGAAVTTLPELLRPHGYASTSVGFKGNPSARGFDRYLEYEAWHGDPSGRAPKAQLLNEVTLPESFSTAIEDQLIIMRCEAAAFHQPMYETRSEEYRPLLRRLIARGLETSATEYSGALERRLQFITDMQVLAENADVLLTPTTPTPALADLTNTGVTAFQGPWTSCGLPTITIPSGLAESGLPMGLQIIAAPFREGRLLAAARWCERALDVHLAPPV